MAQNTLDRWEYRLPSLVLLLYACIIMRTLFSSFSNKALVISSCLDLLLLPFHFYQRRLQKDLNQVV